VIKAKINKIINSTFIDGPGSRMAIFLQGCNMSCLYCHNPETQNHCNNCGVCTTTCKQNALIKNEGKVIYNKELCINCDECLRICPNMSSPKCYELNVEELLEYIIKYAEFLDGITISGGECTEQSEYLYNLFIRIKRETKLTTYIDTNGTLAPDIFKKLCTVTDGFMFDIKAWNKDKHIKLTGLSNENIIKNASYASQQCSLYEIRTVVVKDFTDNDEEIKSIANYIKNLNDYTLYKLIAFRPIGVKTHLLTYQPTDSEIMNRLLKVARDILGHRVSII